MTGTLDGKRAIVTGGGQGIGRGIALALAREGAAVALVGRTESTLRAVAAEIGKPGGTALPIVADITRPDDIRSCVAHTVSELGGIDILVNNAQIPRWARSSTSRTRHSALAGNPGRWPPSG